jgi:hypothetical protein
MIQFHTSIFQSLKHSGTWAGLGVAIGSAAQGLHPPYSNYALIAAGICGGVAAITRSPNDGETV